ncbi:MAG: VWA domain-containing protein [Deltaproteobacteria bacterium]|nr:VWA domain-containing protein [Deltaproteobacteria bacterium]
MRFLRDDHPRYLDHRRLGRGAALMPLLLVALASPAAAGPLFFAGRLEQGRFVPAAGQGQRQEQGQQPCFQVLYSTIRAELAGGRAHTRIDETVAGPEQGSVATVGLIPLPAGTSPGEVKLLVDGKDMTALEGRFLAVPEARAIYEQIARALRRVDVLALADRPALLLPVFTLKRQSELTMELDRPLGSTSGLQLYESPLPLAELGRGPVERITLTATLKTRLPLRTVFSPSHEITVERNGLREAIVRHRGEQLLATPDFRLYFAEDEDPLGLRLLAHRAPDEDAGYFLLLGNPSGEAGQEKPLPKDLLLVLDISGSMRGEKMEQARSAIEYCLERLNPGDRFNVVTFGTEVTRFADQPVAATGENVQAARAFVDEAEALGRTNISGALAAGLAGQPQGTERPRIMIFLTDGAPTAGELDPRRIIERLPTLNTSGTRLFVLGVGHDVNAHLLDRLAEDSDGSSEYLAPDEEIDVKVAALYDRLSHPVLTRVQLGFGGLNVRHVYPDRLPALFKGSDVLILGRYTGGGQRTLSISGTIGGQARTYQVQAELPEQASAEHDFVASLWASRRIGDLLAQIRLHGEKEALVQEVVQLSRSYGIVTEYTEFLSQGNGLALSTEQAAAEATRLMREANAHQAGSWAVMQAGNEKALRQKTVSASTANAYVDRLGRKRVASKVKQVGRRVFYEQDGRWVESRSSLATGAAAPASAPPQPARKVQAFSDEYFQLLRRNKDFARAQSLGGKVTIELEGQMVEVE